MKYPGKTKKDGYGGVLIAIKRNIIYELVPTYDTCELIAVKDTCKHNSVSAVSMYRPTNNDIEYATQLATAMEKLLKKHTKDVIWIGGNSNVPDMDWSTNTISGSNHKREINELFLQAADKCSLDQVVDFPTRDTNLLDVLLTNKPPLIQACSPLTGVSDHEIVYIESNVSAKYQRPIQRKIWFWAKADIPKPKEDMVTFSEEFTNTYSIKSDVNTIWTEFSAKCTQLMTNHIPSKLSSKRFSQPWINMNVKRLSRKKMNAYNKACVSKKQSFNISS